MPMHTRTFGKLSNGLFVSCLALLFVACVPKDITVLNPTDASDGDADKLLVVDCLLPGQIRKLGQGMTYVTPRRPAKLTALSCEQRGGEYVAFEQANAATALKVWLSSAQEGDPVAQTYVGEIYERGVNHQPDYKMAAAWYKRAADQGHSRAKLNLGYLFEKGLGVEKNLSIAMHLYREASGIGDSAVTFAAAATTEGGNGAVLQALKHELEQEKQKLASVTKQAEQTQQRLEQERREFEGQNEVLQAERAKMQAESKLAAVDKAQLARLEQQLVKREADLENRRQKARQLENELATYRQQMHQLENTQVALAGPSIMIAKPNFVNIRGATPVIKVRSETKTRELVGSIVAPAGLQSLKINGQGEQVDAQGNFRVLLDTSASQTTVRVAAVDKLGKQENIEFSFEHLSGSEKVGLVNQTQAPALLTQENANEFGNFHALVIGNNDYQSFPTLKTAVNDAQSVASLLSNGYGFKVTTLVNANRFMLLATLNRLASTLKKNDNLLIYYAGHGELDEDAEIGYWLPVDADRTDKKRWLSNGAITDILNTLPAKRILVVADSCYSGSLTASAIAASDATLSDSERLAWLRSMAKVRSRVALTSGALKPVSDEGGNNHSVFADALLEVLDTNQNILDGQRLFREVKARMSNSTYAALLGQVPQYAPIKHSGHESGEFFFLPSAAKLSSRELPREELDSINTIATQQFLQVESASAQL